jgi:hypothetical protein
MPQEVAVVYFKVSDNMSVGTEDDRFLDWHSNSRTSEYDAELVNTEQQFSVHYICIWDAWVNSDSVFQTIMKFSS